MQLSRALAELGLQDISRDGSRTPDFEDGGTGGPDGVDTLTAVLEHLHLRVARAPLSPLTRASSIHAMITSFTGDEIAIVVERSLCQHFRATSARIRAFRASVVFPFVEEVDFWPVLEWIEGEDTEVLAIFQVNFDVEPSVCSWVMHYGTGRPRHIDGAGWATTSIVWNVAEMGDLKSLFHAAQHLLGVLGWSSADAHKLYCRLGQEYVSVEEYVSRFVGGLILRSG